MRDSVWRRPALLCFFIGCCVSLSTSGRLTLRLVVPAALYATLLPLVEIATLRLLLGRQPKLPFPSAIELFYRSYAAWCLWMLALVTAFAFLDPVPAYRLTGPPWGLASMLLVIAWSAYRDYRFFRTVSPERAGRNLLVQRAVCWSVLLAIFGGASIWPGFLGVLGQ
jgi:hypothetical protein